MGKLLDEAKRLVKCTAVKQAHNQPHRLAVQPSPTNVTQHHSPCRSERVYRYNDKSFWRLVGHLLCAMEIHDGFYYAISPVQR